MKKTFNITGTCYPEDHYLMDNTRQLQAVRALIEGGNYFTINRPRQYGKTTTFYFLLEELSQTEAYFPIALNFQGIDRRFHQSDTAFGQMFLEELSNSIEKTNPDLAAFLNQKNTIKSLNDVSEIVEALIEKTQKKIVLLIDEVDASSEYAAFINFLGMLRRKYLNRKRRPTFHSIVLAGVHDIKNLKYKLRNPDNAQYNSPWNIAVDFEVDMSFQPQEIVPMLEEYSKIEEVKMDASTIAQRLYYHTSGYPFLVSKLCKNIAEKILPNKPKSQEQKWTLADIEASVQLLLKENNTNFDSLIGNIENHKDLQDLVYRIILNGDTIPFNQYNPTIYKGILYGIFKRNGRIRIHNRIYEQLLYDYLASKIWTTDQGTLNYSGAFLKEDRSLDMEAVLRKFQAFMKEQRSQKDLKFLEREWRLVFLAFLKPILNGQGHDFKEVETSEEKRLDVVVTYLQFKYILELKLWRGAKAHTKGLNQLATYLDIHGINKGYLLIFDTRKKVTFDAKPITHQGKEIYMVWV